ncbi:hypothetical protein Pla110_42290 [Polystyrenella longa]|uniref:DUF1559 domain-containing protein n=1 Tax=Polystyrenella longa TaxID=2528007 RepID=A0A518CTB0_9PLAN|nr:DUF1559 domain-containing protein [Polystyrenella longa]QDU82472.1 hypothetical protein Pla110_42290 [Polystyrenella longa]
MGDRSFRQRLQICWLKCDNASISRTRCRRAFTVLELITVIAILTVLLALLLPSLGSARESARRIQCQYQLRQLGTALQGYHELNRSLPPGFQWEETEQSAYGWSVPLLSFLEQRAVYDQIHSERLLTDPVP